MITYKELKTACSSGASISALAKRFGCSKTTVRHWLKKYSLETLTVRTSHVGEECACTFCQRAYVFDKTSGHTLTVCNSCVVLRRKYIVKKQLVELLGGACKNCGYSTCLGALHFHHTDDNKEFALGSNYNRSFKTLKVEASKCQLLCANCHSALHYGDRNWDIHPVGSAPTDSSV